ncbi:unnamed protein product [Onchocerca flexuosa]|uniref:Uncharacterized protein n=1 Tax=Onchocerca flexuosa TaxID=387005 RepID=A0A183HIU0_9BILA|nr:unnamed protein product [Onchocerca flexuosa]
MGIKRKPFNAPTRVFPLHIVFSFSTLMSLSLDLYH